MAKRTFGEDVRMCFSLVFCGFHTLRGLELGIALKENKVFWFMFVVVYIGLVSWCFMFFDVF